MECSFLYPPNIHALSDSVIGAVTQRSRPYSARIIDEIHDGARDGIGPEMEDLRISLVSATTAETKHSDGLQTMGAGLCLSTRKEQQSTSKDTSPSRLRSSKTGAQAISAEEKKRRNQERCRRNQIRYRSRRQAMRVTLEITTRQLQDEVKMLELRRHDVVSKSNCWSVVVEYFRMFRYGFRSPSDELYGFVLSSLRLTMAPDVTDGEICGVDALVGNWKLFSLSFDGVQFELERMERCGAGSLIAITTTTVTISSNSLESLFPHLVSNMTSDTDGAVLATKLLGQRFVMRGSVRFDWDDIHKQVASMQTQADLLTPVLRLLGNLQDVSRVFEGAFVTPDCRLTAAR